MNSLTLAESGWLPDGVIRWGIRRLLQQRLQEVAAASGDQPEQALALFASELRNSPLVVATEEANEQHYEVPSSFFELVLGPRLKYSAGYWPHSETSFAESEESMLMLTCQRAELSDGQEILELGCGWGSLTLWMAEHYPHARITAISNSHSQRQFIEAQCRQRAYEHVTVITTNIADFDTPQRFDRVVSVEMFEHVRNYELLLCRISNWLKSTGKLFVHIFCHRQFAYAFEDQGPNDWMARNFFSGGIMPAANLLAQFRTHLAVEKSWQIEGCHYGRTCEAWLVNIDQHREAALAIFRAQLNPYEAARQVQRWRMFFLACAELFNYRQGQEWGIGHYLLAPVVVNEPRGVVQRLLGTPA